MPNDRASSATGLAPRQQRRRADAERLIAGTLQSPDLTVAFLCRELAMSHTNLYRLFEPVGGVQAYIRTQRLEAVRQALLHGPDDLPIHGLAKAWHFNDSSHLTRWFKGEFGLPPRRYRDHRGLMEIVTA